MRVARGEPDTTQSDEKTAKWFGVMDKINPGAEGVSVPEMMLCLAVSF